ncbi:hypothetical protein V493_05143 [Pseudogymnoascus sp. VKM F-4281 (FW-2241)]|nr:hypothetical protein V493_05143 [Pseudogymnoascus sp. VKM F-4281 (FW-2241)]
MVSSRPLTWRIQSIPGDFTEERLKSCFHSDDKKCIEIKSLVPDVNNYDGDGMLTATMLFSPREPREPRVEEYNDFDMDKDFIGFTPLNIPDENVCADIIAVTGLAGHAFGSWAHSAQKMWLRDYLPRDIQNRARILIYGYESQLHGANTAKSIISDYGNSFIQSLMDLRDHTSCMNRPLILIGHSIGALIIKQAITDLESGIRSRLPVRTLIFFGAPHNGLEVTASRDTCQGPPDTDVNQRAKARVADSDRPLRSVPARCQGHDNPYVLRVAADEHGGGGAGWYLGAARRGKSDGGAVVGAAQPRTRDDAHEGRWRPQGDRAAAARPGRCLSQCTAHHKRGAG